MRRSQAGSSRWRKLAATFACAATLPTFLACEEEAPPPGKDEAAPSAEGDKPPVDEKIARAMQAASAAPPAPSDTSSRKEPPPDGILGSAAADREIPRGAPAQVVFGRAGSGDRFQLESGPLRPGKGPEASLEISYRSAGSVMPNVVFDLRSSVLPAASTGAALQRVFEIGASHLARQQPGRLPPGAEAEIAKLGGSRMTFATHDSGAPLGSSLTISGDNPDLGPIVEAAADSLATLIGPYPDQAVGAGAFWMVKSRETHAGADVVAYRMFKVEKVENGAARLNVETRRYLAAERMPLAGLPPHRVRQYQSQGSAQLTLTAGRRLPTSADVQDSFVAVIAPEDRPDQGLPVQSETRARFRVGNGGASVSASRRQAP